MHHYLGIINDEEWIRIKDIAMCRHHVKLSKRGHVTNILDEAFKLLEEWCEEHSPPTFVSELEYADISEYNTESDKE